MRHPVKIIFLLALLSLPNPASASDQTVFCDRRWSIHLTEWVAYNDCGHLRYVDFAIDDPCGTPTVVSEPDWACFLDPTGGIDSQLSVECAGINGNAGWWLEANPEYAFVSHQSPLFVCLWGFSPDGQSPY